MSSKFKMSRELNDDLHIKYSHLHKFFHPCHIRCQIEALRTFRWRDKVSRVCLACSDERSIIENRVLRVALLLCRDKSSWNVLWSLEEVLSIRLLLFFFRETRSSKQCKKWQQNKTKPTWFPLKYVLGMMKTTTGPEWESMPTNERALSRPRKKSRKSPDACQSGESFSEILSSGSSAGSSPLFDHR